MEMTTLRSEYNLAIFLNSFESGTLPKATWTHDAHIAVATLYLLRHHDGASSKTRNAIRRYNESVGTPNTATQGYHETLTVFWLAIIESFLDGVQPGSELETVRQAVEAHGGNRKLHTQYYGFDVCSCLEARRIWVEPDLKALPPGSVLKAIVD